MQGARYLLLLFMVSILGVSLVAGRWLFAQDAPTSHTDNAVFDPTQTYEVFFSFHPREIDRLSNVRLLGVTQLGQKTFLRFQALLNNQRDDGWIDLQTVSAIFPSAKPLVTTPELIVDRQALEDQEKVKEVREETVREIIKERELKN